MADRIDDVLGAKKRTKGELEFVAKIHATTQLYSTIRAFLVCAAVVGVAYCGYLSIREMAGKSTDFKSIIDWAVSFRVSEYVAWSIAAVTGTGFVLERRRGNRIKHQAGPRLAELEKALDPGRTSSTDSPDGSQPDGNNDE